MVESVIKRMMWTAFFFLRGKDGGNNDLGNTDDDNEELNKKYGLRSRRCPPQVKEMIPFEEDMAKLIQNLEFRKICDDFQKQLCDYAPCLQ